MPPRFLSLAIVASWLAVVGWFVCWDVWPRLLPGEQPYVIDLSREVTAPNAPRRWTVFRNGITVGHAESSVTHNAGDETYRLRTIYRFHHFEIVLLKEPLLIEGVVQSLDSTLHVTGEGKLREVEADGLCGLKNQLGAIRIHVTGRVQDGQFSSHWKIDSPLLSQEFSPEPIEVATNHSMLNPMQPWNRLADVQPTRTWRLRLFDPLADSLAALVPGRSAAEPQELEAGVLQEPDYLPWNNQNETCVKIEYRGKDLLGYTWIRKSDGLVLRQEVFRQKDTPDEERLTLERIP